MSITHPPRYCPFFFFNDTATTEIYTLSLHDALPISHHHGLPRRYRGHAQPVRIFETVFRPLVRSEEHTSELQSPDHLVCRLLLEKKNNRPQIIAYHGVVGLSGLLAVTQIHLWIYT